MNDTHAFHRFLWVGLAGFVTDAGLLFLLVSAGMDPFVARFVSFAVAVCVTWFGNRYWTFADRYDAGADASFWAYLGVQGFGIGINYVTYAVVLMVIAPTPTHAVVAAMAGSAVALVLNFLGSSKLVFRARAPRAPISR